MNFLKHGFLTRATHTQTQTQTLLKQCLYRIPNDKPYRQLLTADSNYFFIRFQNETNTDFSRITIDDERYDDDLNKTGFSATAVHRFNRTKYIHKSWYRQRQNEINGGYFYIYWSNQDQLNDAQNVLNKFCQNIEYYELPNTHCIHAIIGESGSNRLKIQESCAVSLFVDIKKPKDLWIVSKELKGNKNTGNALELINKLINPFKYKIESKYCYLILKNARYFNRKHDVLIIYDKNKHNTFTLSLMIEIYGFQQNIQNCILDVQHFIKSDILEMKIEQKYFNLIIGKEATHLLQFEYLLNVDLHSRKDQRLIMFCDRNRNGNKDKLNRLKQYMDDIIKYKIETVLNVDRMRFQRLLYCNEWREIKNITFDYNSRTETLRYWIDLCLYHDVDGDIDINVKNNEEIEIENKVKKCIEYYCFDEFMSYIDIRDGFMPLIRGIDGDHIMQLTQQCKAEFAKTMQKKGSVPIIMPQKQMDSYREYMDKNKEEYVLHTFMRDNRKGKYENESHRIWIFSNHTELLRLFKITLFNLCKNGEIFAIQSMFEDMDEIPSQHFYIKPGILNTRTAAKIYSNGTELFIVGNEVQRQRAKKYIIDMLQEWKLNFIGSKKEEKQKLAKICNDSNDKQQFEEMTKHIQAQTIADINDATLLKHI